MRSPAPWGRVSLSQGRFRGPAWERLACALLVALAALVFVRVAVRVAEYTLDDTFISLRYARHLAEGHGLVYNPGDRVEGYTTFLWTLWLSVPFVLGIDPLLFAKASNVLLVLASAWLLHAIGARTFFERSPWRAWLPGAWMLATPLVAVSAVEGLETPLFTALALAAVLAFLGDAERRFPLAPVALAALAMTRPDGLLFVPFFVVAAKGLGRSWTHVGKAAFVFVVLYGAYFAARWAYYDTFLPNTFYAKRGGTPEMFRRGKVGLHLFLQQYGGWYWVPALLAVTAVRWPVGILLAGFVAGRVAFELWSGGAWMGPLRFLIPVIPVAALATMAAVDLGVRSRGRALAVAAVLVGSLILPWSNWSALRRAVRGYAQGLERAHVALGRHVDATTGPETLLAMDDAGAGPFYARRRNVDMLGLVDAHIARRSGLLGQKYDVDYVLGRRPDLVVLLAVVEDPREPAHFRLPGHAALFADARFLRDYERWRAYVFSPSYHVLAFRRRGSANVP